MLGCMADGPHDSKDQPWLLYAWLILIIALLVLGIVSLPRIVDSIEESRMLVLIRSHLVQKALDKESPDSNLRLVSLAFPIPGADSSFTFEDFPVRVAGKRVYHETIESLLFGPSVAALARGAVSFIPIGTTLIGLSVSNQIAFVDLSDDFLVQTSFGESGAEGAIAQIKRTLRMFDGVRDIVILIDGSPLQTNP
jgi:hypothetical protein